MCGRNPTFTQTTFNIQREIPAAARGEHEDFARVLWPGHGDKCLRAYGACAGLIVACRFR